MFNDNLLNLKILNFIIIELMIQKPSCPVPHNLLPLVFISYIINIPFKIILLTNIIISR